MFTPLVVYDPAPQEKANVLNWALICQGNKTSLGDLCHAIT